MDPSSTNITTEFAIAVAGFTGIVFALDRQAGELSPLVRIRTTTMWLLVMLGNSIFAVWLLVSLLGILPIPITAAFITALTWQLVLSTILFIRTVAMPR